MVGTPTENQAYAGEYATANGHANAVQVGNEDAENEEDDERIIPVILVFIELLDSLLTSMYDVF